MPDTELRNMTLQAALAFATGSGAAASGGAATSSALGAAASLAAQRTPAPTVRANEDPLRRFLTILQCARKRMMCFICVL